MIRAVNHVAVSTPDLERMRSFYCDLLGFEEVSRVRWDVGQAEIDAVMALKDSSADVLTVRLGSMCVELFQFDTPLPAPLPAEDRPVSKYGITHLCFGVDDIDAVYRRMVDAGIRFHCPPQTFGPERATYGRDPDGNVFELQQLMPA